MADINTSASDSDSKDSRRSHREVGVMSYSVIEITDSVQQMNMCVHR